MTAAAQPAVVLLAIAVLGLAPAACGRKGAPRPTEDVLPETISDLEATAMPAGIQLSWGRPTKYTGGDRMHDLGRFRIERADEPGAPFVTVDTVVVTDLERFQQTKRFRYLDTKIKGGRTYRYRVVSFTLDRYVGAPSNIAAALSVSPAANGDTTESAPD